MNDHQGMNIKVKENFVPIAIGFSFLLSVGLYFLFQYANNELAGKTCLIVTHQLQTKYKETKGSFTTNLEELKQFDSEIKNPRKPEEKVDGIDPRCADFFKLQITKADTETFEAMVTTQRSELRISESGEVTTLSK